MIVHVKDRKIYKIYDPPPIPLPASQGGEQGGGS